MTYKIVRIDGKDDELTAQSFDKYSDAYDLLEELYGDLCCSDADYGLSLIHISEPTRP